MTKKIEQFPQILIANQLSEGRILWLSETGEWTGPLSPPLIVQDCPSLQRALSKANLDVEANKILDPIAIEVTDDLEPKLAKHKILLSGPTVRRDLGYQAERDVEIAHVSV